MTYVDFNFNDFDDLTIDDIQNIINNQEISYNDILNKPQGVLRVGTSTVTSLVGENKVVTTTAPSDNILSSLVYDLFDLERLYRVTAVVNHIAPVDAITVANSKAIGYMDIWADNNDYIKQCYFPVCNAPEMSGFFVPTDSTHTIYVRGALVHQTNSSIYLGANGWQSRVFWDVNTIDGNNSSVINLPVQLVLEDLGKNDINLISNAKPIQTPIVLGQRHLHHIPGTAEPH